MSDSNYEDLLFPMPLNKPPLTTERLEEIRQAWQPHYDEIGEELTLDDAQEIRDNLIDFFNTLWRIKQRLKNTDTPQKTINEVKNKRP